MAAKVKVIDASALGALLFGEPDGAAVAERLRGVGLIAPALLPFEVPTSASRRCVGTPISGTP
jgi:predicted nucleic acid-binding protein